MKAKCPVCSDWLVKKTDRDYWDYHKLTYRLQCSKCDKSGFNQGKNFQVTLYNDQSSYKELTMSFVFKGYFCHGIVKNLSNNNIVIKFFVTESYSLNQINYIKDFSFNDLCDKNIDILDYNEVYWLFKKEARRWAKLQVFS